VFMSVHVEIVSECEVSRNKFVKKWLILL
jgi:hypothetical protein